MIVLNLIQWVWTLQLARYYAFTMGIYNIFLITIFHLVAYLIKVCIFDRGYSKKNRTVKLPWLCNMTVSDPYDLQPHKKKKSVSKKKGEKDSENKKQVIQVITVNDDLDNSIDFQRDK